MTSLTVTVQESDELADATLVLSREDAARLKVRSGQRVRLEVTAVADGEPDYKTKLRAAIEQMDRGEGIVVSDDDFEAMKREIQELVDHGIDGGTSPTLERLMRAHQAQLAAGAASGG